MRSDEILYVVGSLDIGGSERHLALVTPGLIRLGWRPAIYCLTHRGVLAEELERQGVEIIGPPGDWRSHTKVTKPLLLLASVVKLFSLYLRRRPAIAHFFLPMAYLVGAPLAILTRVPVRVMSRRSLNYYQQNYPLVRRVERMLHRRMQALVGNSLAVVAQLKAESAAGPAIELIYNGVALDPRILEPRKPVNPDSLSIIVVANLIAYKGHADLFRALAAIADRLPQNWQLLCVGRDDGIGKGLSALGDQLGLSQHVKLLGSREDAAALLQAADIGVLCSHEEGFSNAILEGMAAGLPMIVTDVGGNAEAVHDGVTGLIVPAKDATALGQTLLALAADPQRRAEMGYAARQRVEEHFSLTRCVEGYDALYRGLLSRHSAGRSKASGGT